MNPAYIIALFQFIFFSFVVMQLEDIRQNQIFSDKLSSLTIQKNNVESGIYDLEYLDRKNFECFSIIIQDPKTGRETVDKDCKCYQSKIIGNHKIRIPYRWNCRSIPAHWKKMGGIR